MKHYFLPLVIALVSFSAYASADQFRIPLRAVDHNGIVDTVWFGVDPAATYCIDAALGEEEDYPLPPQGFDMRFMGIKGRGNCLGNGLRLDLRTFVSQTQVDTFHLIVRPSTDGYPLVLSWPDLNSYYVNHVYVRNAYSGATLTVDMKSQNSLTITDSMALTSLIIVTGDPVADTVTGPPQFSFAGGQSVEQYDATLLASVNPNGASTVVWFEWGTTASYGSSSPPQSVGAGYSTVLSTTSLSGLSAGTTYHFRSGAQDSHSTVYTTDQVFTTVIDGNGGGKIVVPFKVRDASGDSGTVYFGVYPNATFCIDPVLGEMSLPPPPPSFDVRFVCPRRFEYCFDQGTSLDLRPFLDSTQVDTYKVVINLSNGTFPVTLSWPDLNTLYSNPVFLRGAGMRVNVDMKSQTSYVITDSLPVTSFTIITGNGSASVGSPHLFGVGASAITQTNATLEGGLSPNGLATKAWLEWGTSSVYTDTTPPQMLGAGFDFVSVQYPVMNLSPRTTYHVRLGAQNSMGTVYSGDQTWTTIIDGVVGERLIPLTVADNGPEQVTLWMGVHPQATNCVDAALGESELPPQPPGFDARLINTTCLGKIALNADFRPLIDTAQVDTYKVSFSADIDQLPVTISWPNVNSYFNGAVHLIDRYGGIAIHIDMKTQNAVTIPESLGIYSLIVVTGTPPSAPSPPSVMTNSAAVYTTTAQLKGEVNPNGDSTSAWFEWGPTASYGYQTIHDEVGAGTGTLAISETIGGLSLPAVYHYRLSAQNAHGVMIGPDRTFGPSLVTSVREQLQAPQSFVLRQSYPNPFNPTTTIEFELPKAALVTVTIYNILGEQVGLLASSEKFDQGMNELKFDGSNVSSGVYFYRIVVENLDGNGLLYNSVKKMILVK